MKKIFLFIILLTKFVMSYADNFVPTVVLKNNESHRVGFKICAPTCENATNKNTQYVYIYPGNTYTIPNIVVGSSGYLVTIESLDTAYATVNTNSDGSLSISHSMAPKFVLYKSAAVANQCHAYTVYSKNAQMFLSQNSTTIDSSCGALSAYSTYINSMDSSAIIQIDYNTNMPK